MQFAICCYDQDQYLLKMWSLVIVDEMTHCFLHGYCVCTMY